MATDVYKIVTKSLQGIQVHKKFYESTKMFNKYWDRSVILAQQYVQEVIAYKYVGTDWLEVRKYPKQQQGKIMTSEEKDMWHDLRWFMNQEGFDYCFTGYSNWNEIKDDKFQELKRAYVSAQAKLEDYIISKYEEAESC